MKNCLERYRYEESLPHRLKGAFHGGSCSILVMPFGVMVPVLDVKDR